ncbi:FN3 associated domain-containing protein [Treponema phagedenis]|uniref:FN3 associated domain-containing protein n=1 Tax=Treponema phagedenis TaxID=162 RepID=UPI0015A620A4|nr:FN3 associated domain-containing protein [Treponema phagedenis]NVP25666.1 chitobiase/beta-hexosaminidase C-terminal domain-containing protein [Treponema phagedenis]
MLKKNTQIVYSIDGSDPEQFGLVYTEPVLIDKTGFINLRIKAIKPFRETEEKVIHYSAMRGSCRCRRIQRRSLLLL